MGTRRFAHHLQSLWDGHGRSPFGKLKKVALTACMRKLLILLNAMIRDQKPWKPPQLSPETVQSVANLG